MLVHKYDRFIDVKLQQTLPVIEDCSLQLGILEEWIGGIFIAECGYFDFRSVEKPFDTADDSIIPGLVSTQRQYLLPREKEPSTQSLG